MAKTKRSRPKGVPKDYLIQIGKCLSDKGLDLHREKIKRILRGKSTDIDLTKKVFWAMEEIRKRHKKAQKELKILTSSLKKG